MSVAVLCVFYLVASPPDLIVGTPTPAPNHNCAVEDGFPQDHNLSALMLGFRRMEILAIELADIIDCDEMASKEAMLGLLDKFMDDPHLVYLRTIL